MTGESEFPYTKASLARLAVSQSAQEVSDRAAALVPIRADEGTAARFAGLTEAAGVAADADRLLERAVIAAAASGATWDQIGAKLNVTRQQAHRSYGAAARAFADAAVSRVDDQLQTLLPEGADEADRRALLPLLDAWVLTRRTPDDSDIGEHPVSGGLARVDPRAELVRLTAELARLYDRERAPAMEDVARLVDRQLAMWDLLQDADASEHAAAAESLRASLAELRAAREARASGGHQVEGS